MKVLIVDDAAFMRMVLKRMVEGATRKIREIDPKARILIISAMGQAAMVKEAIQSGAYDFVVKPVDQNRFLSAIANAKKS
jgi:two-component system, chemotaxis family, chemotaxis protein CheY